MKQSTPAAPSTRPSTDCQQAAFQFQALGSREVVADFTGGTLEEVGIELCNLKLGIRPRVPCIFFNAHFWSDLRKQVHEMIRTKRAPAWMADYIHFTDDPDEVVAFYRKKLQVL